MLVVVTLWTALGVFMFMYNSEGGPKSHSSTSMFTYVATFIQVAGVVETVLSYLL